MLKNCCIYPTDPLLPETTIIAFDLHGVVVTSDYRAMSIYSICNPFAVCKLAFFCCNPWFLKDVFHLWRSHAVAGAYLQLIAHKYPSIQSTIPFLIAIGNMQKPNIPLITFIKQLRNQGYSVQLFSNIGDIILDDFRKKYPDIIQLFDAVCNTHKTNDYIGKPYNTAFTQYQTTCNPKNLKVIFIDNMKRNIAAARRHHMIGIHYTTTDALIEQLISMLKL